MCTFGAESVATTGIETLLGMEYKFQITGIPIDGATNIYENRISVISMPLNQSQCYRKNNAVFQKSVCESVAIQESMSAHINDNEDSTD